MQKGLFSIHHHPFAKKKPLYKEGEDFIIELSI